MPKAKLIKSEPNRRTPLSRERIAQAALELIDDEGLESCSMRRLGARLGVEAMALYHHFPSKGDLLDAVMDRLLDEVELPASGTQPPLQRLRVCIRSYRGCAIRHPRAFVLLAARRFNTERAFAFYESLLGVFEELGLDAGQSARWFRLIGGFASGSGLAEVASRERVADATSLQLEHAPERIAYPRVRAVAPHLSVQKLDEVFEFGLDVLFEALAARTHGARTQAAGSGTS
jgi:AcrR family transcriptional regulator